LYLHLGQDTSVYQKTVVGIYDLDNCSASHITRDFLKKAEQAGQIINIAEDIPKSFVITQEHGEVTIYLSQLSTTTLQKRSAGIGFE